MGPTSDVAREGILGADGALPAPSRVGLAALRAAIDEGGGDAEVWERLATRGYIPPSWVSHERRRVSAWCVECGALGFATRDGPPRACPSCDGATQHTWAQPPAALAWSLAADVSGVERAEALADELCARLVARGMRPRGEGLYWRLSPAPVTVALRRWTDYRGPFPPFGPYARVDLAKAVADDLRARDALRSRGDADAELLAPLVSIYELGYAVDTLLSSGVVLVAPTT